MRIRFCVIILANCFLLNARLPGADIEPAGAMCWSNAPDAGRLDWWRQARFGLFIHWGPVSLKGTEIGWSRGANVPVAEYDELYRKFNPRKFNADTWAKVAKDAGTKYLVFTTKHHDGFCNWDTRQTDYNIMRTPFGRDVVKELAAGCKRRGVVFGAYHSICDWHHPDYPLGSPGGKTSKPNPAMDRYNQYLKNQLSELLENYGPLGVLWFDGDWEAPWTVERGRDLYDFCHKLQPSLIINNRLANRRTAKTNSTPTLAETPGDFDTPEQRIGAYQDTRPWETCMTIAEQWAWKPNDKVKSLQQCIHTLVRCAGGDGNLLLNVGPMPDGRIEPQQVKRLNEMGKWLTQYGESIYGTRGGPWKPSQAIASTRKGNFIFVHILKSQPGPLTLAGISKKVVRSSLLTHGKLDVKQSTGSLFLKVTPSDSHEIDTIVKLELDGSALELPAISF